MIRVFLVAAALVVMSAPSAHAYYSTVDTGEVLKEGEYQASFAPQLIFNQYDGANFTGRLDMGLAEGLSARGILGLGKVDFQVGGMVKWVPFPDTESQPAIGGMAGIIISRVANITQTSIRFHPLVSKKIETEIGDVTPFVSLPLGITFQSGAGDTFVPVQFVFGSELRPLEIPKWGFIGEVGLNITKSFGYVTLGVSYRFDDTSFGSKK